MTSEDRTGAAEGRTDLAERRETVAERYDRNWVELLQELRVAQTGVQVLAGFLLTLPFTQRFGELHTREEVLYLVAFGLSILTVGLMTAPVALHRFLFGRHRKDVLVKMADRTAKAALACMGLTLAVVAALLFTVVVGDLAGLLAGIVVLVSYTLAWLVLPLALVRRVRDEG